MRLFLLSLAGALLLLSGCAKERKSVMVDPALLPLVPADTITMGGVRVEALQKTDTWKRLNQSPEWTQTMDEFTKQVGFDPRTDLLDILWTSNGKESLTLVRNRVSQMNIEPMVRREGIQRLSYKGYPLLGDEEQAALFLNPSTAVVGRTQRLREVIDARDGSKGGVSEALLARLASIPAETEVWAIATAASISNLPASSVSSSGLAGNVMANLPRLLSTMQNVTLSLDLDNGLSATAVANCTSDEGARQLQGALKGFAGFARLSLPAEHHDLLPILDSLEVRQKDSAATVYFRADLNALERLQAAAQASKGIKAD